ncbi:MAG: thiamine pyrophosphate-dependent dehydrogenase E1 component subunit alpha [Candidatus Latescibacterota bacterium]
MNQITKDTWIAMYRRMFLSRIVEEKVMELYRAGIKGLYHLYIGEEAVAAGVCTALNRDDYIFSTHRGKGHYIAKGGDLKALMAEFFEKQTGCNRGKGGPMHIIDLSAGMLGANGIVGSSIPLACGAALSAQVRQTGQVAAAFFGDGAVNCGPFHESLNLAALWKLPVLFICENNLFQVSVPSARHCSIRDLYRRADSYGIPGILVDGMDVGGVYEAAVKAVERARQGEGPTLLECRTYRFRGHSEADPTRGRTYRTEQEIASWEERCPVKKARETLRKNGWVSEEEMKEMEVQCQRELAEALAFAEKSPSIPGEWALKDVFTPSQEVQL